MRYSPNSVYPFQKLKIGKRVVFWKILSEDHYHIRVFKDLDGKIYEEKPPNISYVPAEFDNVADENLFTLVRRYMELGYCPAIPIDGCPTGGLDIVSGVLCNVYAKLYSEIDLI